MKAFPLLILFLISFSALATPPQSSAFNNGVVELLKKSPKIIVIGENHINPGLANGVNDLLKELRKHQNFNCLFLELPNDIQDKLESSVSRRELTSFSSAIYTSKIPSMVNAYKSMGYTEEQLKSVKLFFETHQNDPLVNFPFNQETLNYLQGQKISVFADDEVSNGPDFFKNTLYSILDQYYPEDRERSIQEMQAGNVRSGVMSRIIDKQFHLKRCEHALVIVGYAHLFSTKFIDAQLKTDMKLNPIQDQLTQMQYSVRVLIASYLDSNQTSLIIKDDLLDEFASFSGYLFSH